MIDTNTGRARGEAVMNATDREATGASLKPALMAPCVVPLSRRVGSYSGRSRASKAAAVAADAHRHNASITISRIVHWEDISRDARTRQVRASHQCRRAPGPPHLIGIRVAVVNLHMKPSTWVMLGGIAIAAMLLVAGEMDMQRLLAAKAPEGQCVYREGLREVMPVMPQPHNRRRSRSRPGSRSVMRVLPERRPSAGPRDHGRDGLPRSSLFLVLYPVHGGDGIT